MERGESMYECKNCGAELRFDPESQKMKCDHCGSFYDPYDCHEGHETEENTEFGVKVFRCPQCGGEIYTTNTTAASFCMYCGSPAILESRVQKEKKPEKMVPFIKTKEDCKEIYRKQIGRFPFAPSELKNADYLNRFVGVYVPYWLYDTKPPQSIALAGEQTSRVGDYIYHDHYRITGEIDASYEGLSFDASSSFDDHISEGIAPFPVEKMKPFTPAMLCGFYADTADVSAQLYEGDVKSMVGEDVLGRIHKDQTAHHYYYSGTEGDFQTKVEPQFEIPSVKRALFPVWFLTYRKKDRVAYAVVNGVTGKLAADLPIDEKKYMISSALMAIPIFILLNFFLVLTPQTLLSLTPVLALIAVWLYAWEIREIVKREARTEDAGYQSLSHDLNETIQMHEKSRRSGLSGVTKAVKRGRSGRQMLLNVLGVVVFSQIVLGGILPALVFGYTSDDKMLWNIFNVAALLGCAFFFVGAWISEKKTRHGSKFHLFRLPPASIAMLSAILALVVRIWNPVSDVVYYLAALVTLAGIVLTMAGIIERYNELSTRPLPEFHNREVGA